jgi:hypothetical protein
MYEQQKSLNMSHLQVRLLRQNSFLPSHHKNVQSFTGTLQRKVALMLVLQRERVLFPIHIIFLQVQIITRRTIDTIIMIIRNT